MLEDPEQFQEPSVVTAARAFSAVLGVPVPQLGGAHAGRVRAVVLLFLPYFPDAPGCCAPLFRRSTCFVRPGVARPAPRPAP